MGVANRPHLKVLFVILLAGGTLSRPVMAEDCVGSAPNGFQGWATVEVSEILVLPLAPGGEMELKSSTLGFAVAAGLRFPNDLFANVLFDYFRLQGEKSFVVYVRQMDVLLEGGYAWLSTRYVDWSGSLRLGLSSVTKRFFQPRLTPEGNLISVTTPDVEYPFEGTLLETRITAPHFGAATRLSAYPWPWLAIFLEAGVGFTYNADLKTSQGALTLRQMSGIQVHF